MIRAAGVPGEVLPWRDVLHEGPVPANLPLAELGEVRARFIAGMGWGSEGEVRRGFAERDAALAGFALHDEVVLWFEHDLYDQLQLVQLLDFFASQALGATHLSLICGDEYLGSSSPERLAERFPGRAAVTGTQLALGTAAWRAFRSPDPREIGALIDDDAGALPFLGAALRRHLEQFPSTRDGLSRSERQALEAVAATGETTVAACFAAHQRREEPVWLGDTTFASYLEELARGASPLVTIEVGGDAAAVMERRVALTAAGRAVLEGREDRVRLNGIDRWLGGVHLRGHEPAWRWDPGAATIVAMP